MGIGRMLVGHGGHREHGELITRPGWYEALSRIGFLGRTSLYRELVRLSGARSGDRVLDVGCGTGHLAGIAARVVGPEGNVLGVDASAEMVGFARAKAAPGCRFEVGSAQELPCGDGEFDVVLSSLMLHHLPDQDQAAALREMRRVLRPGGRLTIADFRPPRSSLGRHLVGLASGPRMLDNPDGRLPSLVRDAGFTVEAQGERGWLAYVTAVR